MGYEILIILALILVNGFFSLSEMSIVSSRKARLRQRMEKGDKGARLALETALKPGRFLSTVQIVMTLIGTIAGAFGGATVAEHLGAILIRSGLSPDFAIPLSFGLVVVGTTFLSVVFGELVPKNIALSKPEVIAGAVALPMRVLSMLFLPLVKILSAATEFVLMLIGAKNGEEPLVTEEEVKVLIAQGTETGIFDEREKAMFEGVLYLGDRKVTTFMTPRTDIVYIEESETPGMQLGEIIESSEFGHIPLVNADLDHVLGVVNVKAVLAAAARGDYTSISTYVDQPLFVPESMGALDLFTRFKEAGCRIAIIVDEYGGVAGLVTFSDLAEAILGEVTTAGVIDEQDIVRREDGSFLVDGGVSVDDFCEQLGISRLDLDGDFETIAGFALDRLGTIPYTGELFDWNSWHFEIVDMDGNRIDKLLVTPPATADSGEPQPGSGEMGTLD